MVSTNTPKFGVRFLSRKERTVRRVTKCETREIQKRLEPPKPVKIRPPPKPKVPKKAPVPATICKPPKPPQPPRVPATRASQQQPSSSQTTTISTKSNKAASSSAVVPRTLQMTDLEKLARLNCSREFSLFNQFIKAQLGKSYENQLAFLQTKLQHLKNEFVNKQAEHLNFEQIREYYNEAVNENVRRNIQPDEYLTLVNKLKEDIKQAIDKWLKKKEFKPQKQLTEFLQRRQARIRERIKETIEEAKKIQQSNKELEITTESIETSNTIQEGTIETAIADEDVMIID